MPKTKKTATAKNHKVDTSRLVGLYRLIVAYDVVQSQSYSGERNYTLRLIADQIARLLISTLP
jgi:hypothetical protein